MKETHETSFRFYFHRIEPVVKLHRVVENRMLTEADGDVYMQQCLIARLQFFITTHC